MRSRSIRRCAMACRSSPWSATTRAGTPGISCRSGTTAPIAPSRARCCRRATTGWPRRWAATASMSSTRRICRRRSSAPSPRESRPSSTSSSTGLPRRCSEPPREVTDVPTLDDVAKQPLEQRLSRMTRTAADLARALAGQSEAVLVRRPDLKNWAPKEIVCHLRDTEELFLARLEMIAAMDEPAFGAAGHGARILTIDTPDRWAEDRQYLRNDAAHALETFRKRREDLLAHLRALAPAQWQRGGIHPTRGRMTVEDFATLIAWHDDNHLDQLRRALDGKA